MVMAKVWLRPVEGPVDYVLWDGTNLSEMQDYIDPAGTTWKPQADGTDLLLTGSASSPYSSPPVYRIPAGMYIHATFGSSPAALLTLLPQTLVGWSYQDSGASGAVSGSSSQLVY